MTGTYDFNGKNEAMPPEHRSLVYLIENSWVWDWFMKGSLRRFVEIRYRGSNCTVAKGRLNSRWFEFVVRAYRRC